MKYAILDWGTYNALGSLKNAVLLGTRLTEIPPRVFSRKAIDEKYFKEYKKTCKGVFTTVTAHAPYYSLTSDDPETLRDVERAMKSAIKLASIAGAEMFNVHIGSALRDRTKAIEQASELIKKLLKESRDIVISLETTYSPKFLGSLDDIKAIIESVNSDRVIVSLQLDNDFIRELEIYKNADFNSANSKATVDFWINLFKRAMKLTQDYFSVRFSQVIGMYLKKRFFVKKRVSLGRGYPDLQPLSKAIAQFIYKEIYDKGLPMEVHVIYTGPTSTKFRDTILLASSIISEVAQLL